MKFGFWVIVALILGAVVAHFLLSDPGYVIINFRSYLIEMSVPVLIALLLTSAAVVWLGYRLLRLPRRFGEAVGQLRSQRAGRQFTKGLIAVAEGKLSKGERLLTRGASRAETPLLNYLAAARVAHLQGATERRDNWLTMAYEETPGAANAVLLTQAELQLANEQYEQALATLRRVEENVPGLVQAELLLGRTYAALRDWDHLGPMLAKLRKHGRVDAATLTRWERAVAEHQLNRSRGDAAALKAVWNGLGNALRQTPEIAAAYVDALASAGGSADAEATLRKLLHAHWSGPLVRLYGLIDGGPRAHQLKTVEDWLARREEDADLLLAAGRLCMRDELWGKARSYLESALALRPDPETYRAYGELLTRLGEDERAAEAFRTGLGLAAGDGQARLPHLAGSAAGS